MKTFKMRIPPIEYLISQGFMLVLAYFLPVKPLIHGIFFLFAIDWILGVWKSKKANRRLTSYRFRKSISKITTYVVLIMSMHVMETTFLPDWASITKIAAGYIAFTEIVSITENASEITGKRLLLELKLVIKRQFETFLKSK